MKDFKIEDLSLLKIVVANAAIENPNGVEKDDNASTKVLYSLGFEKGLNIELQRILVSIFLNIEFVDDSDKPIGVNAKFKIQFHFHVEDLKEYTVNSDASEPLFTIDSSLSASILNVAYSTARGIIYTRCLGTIMGDIVLPIVSVQELLKISDEQLLTRDNQVLETKV